MTRTASRRESLRTGPELVRPGDPDPDQVPVLQLQQLPQWLRRDYLYNILTIMRADRKDYRRLHLLIYHCLETFRPTIAPLRIGETLNIDERKTLQQPSLVLIFLPHP